MKRTIKKGGGNKTRVKKGGRNKTRVKKGGKNKTRVKKGGRKTGEFYTVIKDWTPEQEPPYHPHWSHLEVDSKTQILFLTIGDRIELRSKKKKIRVHIFTKFRIIYISYIIIVFF